jgi:hypothetical protein
MKGEKMIFENFDSQVQVTNDTKNYAIATLGFLANTFDNTPVYFVRPETMDKIYPPKKRICLDGECVKETLKRWIDEKKDRERSFDRSSKNEEADKGFKRTTESTRENSRNPEKSDENEEQEEDIWVKIQECARKTTVRTIAIAVYDENPTVVNVEPKPSVFICNERVENIGNDLVAQGSYEPKDGELCFKNLFTAVFLHELTHAYIKTPANIYSKAWGKMIEESLCNAVAYRLIKNWKARSILSHFFLSQPVEYTGYSYFQLNTEKFMPQLDIWVKKDIGFSPSNFPFTGFHFLSNIVDFLPGEFRK